MSIMGMREWFRKNRVLMLVIFVLLLVGLLISYGRFGRSSSYSGTDYESLLAQAREAYAADPANPESVLALAQVLSTYAEYLNHGEENRERVEALDDEALLHYDEYYSLLIANARAAYQEDQSYANAMLVANALSQRAQVQSLIKNMDGAALADEANSWMVVAVERRVADITAEMADKPDDPAMLADLADAKSALAYYNKIKDNSFDTAPGYREALQLYLRAIENCAADADPTVKAGYYTNAGFCSNSLGDSAAAEEYLRTAVQLAPADYDINLNYLSYLLNESRYEEGKALLETCRASMSKDEPDYAELQDSLQEYIDYIQSLIDAENNPDGGENNGDAQ